MGRLNDKRKNAARRQNRVRTNVRGTSERPRMSVRISASNISVQLIDDQKSATLASYSTIGIKLKGTMTEKAEQVGTEVAKIAKSKKIKKVVLDRGSRLYHGRIKAFAEKAREGGLEF